MEFSSLEKTGFVLSLAVLVYLYGFVSTERGWFPHSYVENAYQQARAVYNSRLPPGVGPKIYERTGTRLPEPDRVQPGVTLVTTTMKSRNGWRPGLKLIDKQGRVLHTWSADSEQLFPDSVGLYRRAPDRAIIHGSHLFHDGDVLFNLEYVGTVRLDACGRVRWRLPLRGHHSISRTDGGTFWVSGVSRTPRSKSKEYPDGYPGLSDPVWIDYALHVSGDGEVLERINILDVVYENGLDRYIPKMRPQPGTDIIHLNDVEELSSDLAKEYPLFEAGDLLVSLRHIDLVFVFDPESGTVRWHASDPFIGQHDPDFIGDGWIGVFDNNEDYTRRGTMLGGSRVVTVQPHTDSMDVRFPTPQSEPLYTGKQGKWQELKNGNLLLTETEAGRVVEVAPSGRTVWEYIPSPYSRSMIPTVKEATRYDLSRREIESWPCSSTDTR